MTYRRTLIGSATVHIPRPHPAICFASLLVQVILDIWTKTVRVRVQRQGLVIVLLSPYGPEGCIRSTKSQKGEMRGKQ